MTTTVTSRQRGAYAGIAALLLAAAIFEATRHDAAWQLAVFGLGPDVALLLGAGRGLEHGRLHPRAVPLYNLLHRFAAPIALAALATVGIVSVGYLAGALAWGAHIALDRALGYGLRDEHGFQRS
jgi:Domain of unknown function (DUF4260)